MSDIIKKYQNQFAISLLLIICPQIANYAYYHQLNVNHELLKPFDFLDNIFYTYYFVEIFTDFFLMASIIYLIYRFASFTCDKKLKPHKGLNIFRSQPKISTALLHFKDEKCFLRHQKARRIPEWFIYHRLFINKETILFITFLVILCFLPETPSESSSTIIRLSLIAYTSFYLVKYIFPMIFRSDQFRVSSLNLVVPL